MGFQGVAFMPFQARFYTTFSKICGRGESHKSNSCLMTVVGGEQRHASVKYFCSCKAFFVSVKFHGYHKTVSILR